MVCKPSVISLLQRIVQTVLTHQAIIERQLTQVDNQLVCRHEHLRHVAGHLSDPG